MFITFQRLLDAFTTIKSIKVHRAALWILGEYTTTAEDIQTVMSQVRQTLGEVSNFRYLNTKTDFKGEISDLMNFLVSVSINQGPLCFPAQACLSSLSTPTHRPSLKPIFMNLTYICVVSIQKQKQTFR